MFSVLLPATPVSTEFQSSARFSTKALTWPQLFCVRGITDIVESSQLEADYRIVLHILDALKKFEKLTVTRNDTDVVGIVTGNSSQHGVPV